MFIPEVDGTKEMLLEYTGKLCCGLWINFNGSRISVH